MEQTILILIIIGFILIGVSLYLIKKEEKDRKELNLKLDEAFTSINDALESFDIQVSDFNNTCELIFREIEEKSQELFVLYGLIEEQKNNGVVENTKKKTNNKKSNKQEPAKKTTDNSFIYKNKNATEIFKLYDEGMSVTEIAKKLSIGKGEVQLMLNIRKA